MKEDILFERFFLNHFDIIQNKRENGTIKKKRKPMMARMSKRSCIQETSGGNVNHQ